jgi:hypothetical protein
MNQPSLSSAIVCVSFHILDNETLGISAPSHQLGIRNITQIELLICPPTFAISIPSLKKCVKANIGARRGKRPWT